MEELISMIVANGLWAALFCILLFYELRDSRRRESRYTQTIAELSKRLGTIDAVKTDTEDLKDDTEKIKSDTEAIRSACGRRHKGGEACVRPT